MARTRTDTAAVCKQIVANVPLQRSNSDIPASKAWKWAAGVHVFPEAICPFCNVVMRSNCLWQINEQMQKIVQVVGLEGKALERLPLTHPHVYGNTGTVCTGGRGNSVAQAVFMGINPNDCIGEFTRAVNGRAWTVFFNRYFREHVHIERKKRARPRLMRTPAAKKAV